MDVLLLGLFLLLLLDEVKLPAALWCFSAIDVLLLVVVILLVVVGQLKFLALPLII